MQVPGKVKGANGPMHFTVSQPVAIAQELEYGSDLPEEVFAEVNMSLNTLLFKFDMHISEI